MYFKKSLFLVFLFLTFSIVGFAQTNGKTAQSVSKNTAQVIKSTPAYAELLLRKTESTADLEDLLVEYTEDFPKVKQFRAELGLLNKEINRILAVNPAEAPKLTLALGKLIVRKVELEVNYENVKKLYPDDRADVKQAKRKVEIFEAAILEILQ